ncbi:MAG: flavin prenyltransferase UbiX [Pseudomonadota bacterium]
MSAVDDQRTITLAFTGASGAQYGLRLLQVLLAREIRVFLLLSKPAQVVIGMETSLKLPGRSGEIERYFTERFEAAPEQLRVFGREEWTSPVASGSGAPRDMVICPCSMATVGAIAAGAGRELIERAADVVIKERGHLIVVPRETPFSVIHLENLLRLAQLGVTILPPSPGFYHEPTTMDDLIDFVVARILDQLDVPQGLMPRWGWSSPANGGDANP